ncbi:MAG TPA: ElyC/SanA/YdcF family protein [Phycisphaerae bacterium]|nr:ElyC/SanA/YdcF family protein [Phycisphaerae bacterium]
MRAVAGWSRALTWGLHVAVALLAVFSLATKRFDLWVDLRMLGGAGRVIEFLWVGSVVLAAICAGPSLGGIWNVRWVNRGVAPRLVGLLLWPTYFLIGCLLVNTGYYFELVQRDLAELDVPITLLAATVLGWWALRTRAWVRKSARMHERERAGLWEVVKGVSFAGVAAGAQVVFFFVLHGYQRVPEKPVDLAVVLGTQVLRNDTASPWLRDRALVAVDLYKRGMVKHILVSGDIELPQGSGDHEHNEATAMYDVCRENGVPEEAISLDPVGMNTRATAYNTREFMRQHGYSSVVACSTDFHLFRTAMSFRNVGLDGYCVAAKPIEWICAKPCEDVREPIGILVYKFDPNYRAPKAETMKLVNPRVVVKKSGRVLELYDGERRVKAYACITGGNAGDKEVEGDRKTPVGHFHIVYKNPQSKFHLSLGLDYPNREDAERGLKAGVISKAQYAQILSALGSDLSVAENQEKLWKTPLGGEIFLHGHAEGRSGTAGCVALSNGDIEELYAILPVGTAVEIHE